MRKSLLDILRCPRCKDSNYSLEETQKEKNEVKNGCLVCRACNSSYIIEDGIVDFLACASEEALKERKAIDDEDYIKDDNDGMLKVDKETVNRFKTQFLSMPEGDGSNFFRRGGSFRSIRETAARFYTTFNELGIRGDERVLEIGACFGYAAFKFAEKGCSVVALDISNYLKVSSLFSEKKYFDRVFSDLHNAPFMDNTFDVVFGSAVLHHSKDLCIAFRDILRVLKKGGRLILVNEPARGVLEKIHPVFKIMEERSFGDTSYTIPQWKKGAALGGFKKIRIDFLSLADDYINRHKDSDSNRNFKIEFANFLRRNRWIENFLLVLLMPFRLLMRPKSWRLICSK